jgi:hypothetical protein
MQIYQPHHPIPVVVAVDLMGPWPVQHWQMPLALMVQDLAQLQLLHDRQHSWHNPILQTYNTPRLKTLASLPCWIVVNRS